VLSFGDFYVLPLSRTFLRTNVKRESAPTSPPDVGRAIFSHFQILQSQYNFFPRAVKSGAFPLSLIAALGEETFRKHEKLGHFFGA
jgi:hypothetical protein